MAYVNVLEWRCKEVADWLRGLDDAIIPYAHYFDNNNVEGQQLLNLTVSDLTKLHVEKLGHQEIILEALEKLKNLHYNLDTETLQYVALKLSCKARSLFNELCMQPESPPAPTAKEAGGKTTSTRQNVTTQTMSSVAEVLDALNLMLFWLDKPPFGGILEAPLPLYREFKSSYLRLGIELATNAHRDIFAENPINVIKTCCQKLADYSDALIRQVDDPLVLQPAFLNVVTLKRKPDEADFGIILDSSHPGVHIVDEIRFGSAAHLCGRDKTGDVGRVEAGDEIVQINYQTVVGWSTRRTMQLMQLSTSDSEKSSQMILTLKKRPRHLTKFGQIYLKQFRIPARQNSKFNNLPSPRAELLVVPDISFPIPKRKESKLAKSLTKVNSKESLHSGKDLGAAAGSIPIATSANPDESSNDEDEVDVDVDEDLDDEIYLPSTSSAKDISPTQSVRSLLLRPRSTPMRRATISAGSPTKHQPYINVSEIWSGLFDNRSSGSGKLGGSSSGSKQSSNTSTMKSNDSGCATMYSSSVMGGQDYANTSLNNPLASGSSMTKGGRPLTIGPEYINVMEEKAGSEYINLFSCSSSSATSLSKKAPPPPPPLPKQPVPKPRLNVSLSNESEKGGSKKKPMPQPRSFVASPSSSEKTAAMLSMPLMASEVKPVPTPKFKSFKKYPVSAPTLVQEHRGGGSGRPQAPLPPSSSSSGDSSSSDKEDDRPPALPLKRQSSGMSDRYRNTTGDH